MKYKQIRLTRDVPDARQGPATKGMLGALVDDCAWTRKGYVWVHLEGRELAESFRPEEVEETGELVD